MPDPAMEFETLKRRALNDDALMTELLTLFRGEMTGGLAKLASAASGDDAAAASKIAHRLKGSAATIGARSLAALLASAECLLSDGNREAARALLPLIDAEFARCVSEMNARGV